MQTFRFLAGLLIISLALSGCGSIESGPTPIPTPPPTSVGRAYDYGELVALTSCPNSPIIAVGQIGITDYCGSVDGPLEKGQATSRVFSIVVNYPGLSEAAVGQVKATLEKSTFVVTVGDKGPVQTVPVLEIILREVCIGDIPRDGCKEFGLQVMGAIPGGEYLTSRNVQVSWKYAPGKAYDFVPGPPGGK